MTTKKTLTKLVIDRAKWGRGALVREDGKMCCLGFMGLACGLTKEEMKLHGMPHSMDPEALARVGWVGWGNDDSCDLLGELASINDNVNILRPRKERLLIEKFRTAGVELSFR